MQMEDKLTCMELRALSGFLEDNITQESLRGENCFHLLLAYNKIRRQLHHEEEMNAYAD